MLADPAGNPVARLDHPLRKEVSPDAVIRRMARVGRRILREAGVPDRKVLGVGLACPGPLGTDGVMASPSRLPDWDRVPIKALLREYTGFSVTVDNDATAAAVGERWAGIARSAPGFAYLGTGIGRAMACSSRSVIVQPTR